MFDLNGCIKSADSMGDCGADSYQTCIFQCLIPISQKYSWRRHELPNGYGP